MNRYPKKPLKVRFSEEEIENYLENSITIVKNYLVKNKIASWACEKF